ncbi:MAG: T9SS type A sorting domain-containing protein [Bacteroidota bacterium]
MKKVMTLFFLSVFCFSSRSFAQTVQLLENNTIDIAALATSLSKTESTQLSQELTNYQLYEIDVSSLHQLLSTQGDHSTLTFHLPGQADLTIYLFEHDLRSPEYQAVAITEQGKVPLTQAKAVSTFRGTTADNRHVRLNITENSMRGFIKNGTELLMIEPLSNYNKKAKNNLFLVFNRNDYSPLEEGYCGITQEMEDAYLKNLEDALGGTPEEETIGCFQLEIATDADFEFFTGRGGSNVATANTAILGDLNLVEGLFFDQIDVAFIITFQRVWATAVDPYTEAGTPSSAILAEIRDEWENNMTAIQRDVVHMFSGKNHGGLLGSVSGGLGAICANPSNSHGFTADRFLGFETTAHEIGHNFSGVHGDGICGGANPTTMCQGTNKSLNFSAASITRITNHINANSSCLLRPVRHTTSFESNFGDWTQDPGDDFNWTRRSGTTPSTNTGPSAAYNGNFYAYTEASGANHPNQMANLVSPCFELCNSLNTQFTFGYHLYGSSMGTLNVQVTEDNGASWTTVWTRSGNSGDWWQTASINLSAYDGSVIQIRFNGITGSSFRSDMAIDDVQLGPPCSLTVSTEFLPFPQEGGNLSFTINSGSNWEANVSAGSWISVSPTSGAFFQTVTVSAPANNSTAGRNGTLNISCGGTVRSIIVIQAGLPIDPPEPCGAPFGGVPSIQGFESNISPWNQDTGDDMDWVRRSGSTPSSSTGPSSAYEGSYYMHIEASFPNYPSKVGNLVSNCFDLTNAPDPEISFAYHMYGSNMGTLRLQVSTNDGASWVTLWSRSGNVGTTWQTHTQSLASYTNVPIQLRFNGTTGSSYRGDMAIDAVNVRPVPVGLCFDQYEPNDTYQTAFGTTGPSLNFDNACLSAGDNDYFFFFNTAFGFTQYFVRVRGNLSSTTGDYRLSINLSGSTVTIETHPVNGSTTDTYLYLYDSNGTTVLAQNNNSGTGLFSRIVYTLPTAPEQGITGKQALHTTALNNYPNPLDHTTTFAFALDSEQTINLSISDIDGKMVAQPIRDNVYGKGQHRLIFDASQLPMGVYFYTLQTTNGVLTKQMVIAR